MSLVLEFTIRSSVILLAALVAMRLLRGQSAALRHSVLAAAMACAGLMPAVSLMLPAWEVPVFYEEADNEVEANVEAGADAWAGANSPPHRGGVAAPTDVRTAQTGWSGMDPGLTTPPAPNRNELFLEGAGTPPLQGGEFARPVGSSFPILTALWAIGFLSGLTILLAHSRRLARIASSATPIRRGKWSRFADEISRLYGLRRRRLRLLETSHPSVLATWGVLYPDVLLPASARDWSDERVRVVLSHELAHVRRYDWPIQIAAEILRAMYWFNPLFWIACSRIRQESEQACDDAVITLGISNSDYAAHLLDLVRTLREPAYSWTPSLSMARPSTLERRFRALLNPQVDRRGMTRLSIAAITTIFLGITIPVAAFRAASAELPAPPAVIAARVVVPPQPEAPLSPPQNPVQPPAPVSGGATVEGIVVKAGTGEAIPGATVDLIGAVAILPGGGRGGAVFPPLSTTSAQDGRFVFQNVGSGDYRIAAAKAAGYVFVEYGQRSPTARGTIVTLAAGQKFTGARIEMTATGSISGRILDRDGEPVARAQVQALQLAYALSGKYFKIIQSVQTNDLGEYRLFWLPPGPYYISARAEDPRRRQAPIFVSLPGSGGTFEQSSPPVIVKRVLDNGEIAEETFVLVYFPGTTDGEAASRIDVRSGEDFRGIDFAISAGQVRARHVRGRVINGLTGEPSRANVQAIPRRPSPNAAIAAGTADQNGFFDISGVVPGAYYLQASGAGAPPDAASGLVYIEVNDSDLENVTVVATTGFNIPGRVTIEGRTLMPNDPDLQRLRIGIAREPNPLGLTLAGGPPGLATGNGSGVVSADGAFTLRNVGHGDYRVNVAGLAPALYMKSMRMGAVDLLSNALRVDKLPDGEIEIVLGSAAGTIEGRVVGDKREPLASVRVALVPEAPRRQRLDMYQNTSTDPSGRFLLQGITPGEYKIFAWSDVERNAWQDADFIRAYEGRGKPVRVGDGTKEKVEVTVIGGGK
jgi:beta-lactamase regulating signal transducer with metallopeptidase domain